MKDEKLRERIKLGMMETPPGFTDQVMRRIEQKSPVPAMVRIRFGWTALPVLVMIFFLRWIPDTLNLYLARIHLSPSSFIIVFTLIYALLLYKLTSLKKQLENAKGGGMGL